MKLSLIAKKPHFPSFFFRMKCVLYHVEKEVSKKWVCFLLNTKTSWPDLFAALSKHRNLFYNIKNIYNICIFLGTFAIMHVFDSALP